MEVGEVDSLDHLAAGSQVDLLSAGQLSVADDGCAGGRPPSAGRLLDDANRCGGQSIQRHLHVVDGPRFIDDWLDAESAGEPADGHRAARVRNVPEAWFQRHEVGGVADAGKDGERNLRKARREIHAWHRRIESLTIAGQVHVR